jgi:Domain of unknown function (DUF5615)
MLRLAVDEDFDQRIVLGLKRLRPDLDIVRAREVGLSGVDDPGVLRWAASEERVLVTHDVNTMTRYAYQRAAAGQRMPGVLAVSQSLPIGRAVEDLLLLAECTREGELEGRVLHLPLK